ncbi:DNA ligase [Streptomyces sp. GbtcB7]|uniref:ATP-dependent DNA ligase n=1 Tax=Streptomyces sp. GbtcB7 TaxID=2824752 RepID=UPI0020C6B679|nr:DNA ligase [Streptomyces sp. GbtcB7]
MITWRTGDGVRLQARSGRDVTAAWGDLALAGLHLPAGTVLDGEAVITTEDGRISFEAAQARAASSPTRARRLAVQRPAHYIAFDALQLPSPTGGIRARPYNERRAALLNLLAELPAPTPIQGVEGIVAKRVSSPYRAGRTGGWQKIRHAETVDADVVGYTGPKTRPRALAVRLANGRTALTQPLSAPLAAQIAQILIAAGRVEQGRTDTGETYTRIPSGLAVVEVLAGTTRHAVVTPLRLR